MADRSFTLGGALKGLFTRPTIDEDTWDDLEAALIGADFEIGRAHV